MSAGVWGVRFSPRQAVAMARAAVASYIDDHAPSMGAALAYYTLFSLAPLLLIAISVAGLVFGAEAAQGEIFGQLQSLVGSAGAATVQDLLESVNRPAGGVASIVLGVLLMLVGATTVFAELQDALDRIWRVPARQSTGLWALLRARVLSLGLILGLGFLLIVSMLFSAAVAAVQKWWSPWLGGWEPLLGVVNAVSGFVLVTLLFAMIYKVMPRARIAWSDVWVGAVVTAGLFSLGRALITAYLATGAVGSGFGAAGALVVVLVWVYYSAQIFLLGAEFTWVFARTVGSRQSDRPLESGAPPRRATLASAKPSSAMPGPLHIVFNLGAGHGDADAVRQAIHSACAAAGRPVQLLDVPDPRQLAAVAAQAVRAAQADGGVVVAAGGDGTINTVAQAVLGSGCAFGVLPQGTFNYFSRTHGIPAEPDQAMQVLLTAPAQPVQVGLVNGRVFLVNASLGLYPRLLEDREAWKRQFGRSRLVALGAGLVSMLRGHRSLRLALVVQGRAQALRTPTLFIGNNALQMEQLGLPQAQAIDDGALAVVALRPVGRWAMLGLLLRGALGRLGDADQLVQGSCQQLTVLPPWRWGGRTVKVATDGEVHTMRLPLQIGVSSTPLLLLRPAARAQERVQPSSAEAVA